MGGEPVSTVKSVRSPEYTRKPATIRIINRLMATHRLNHSGMIAFNGGAGRYRYLTSSEPLKELWHLPVIVYNCLRNVLVVFRWQQSLNEPWMYEPWTLFYCTGLPGTYHLCQPKRGVGTSKLVKLLKRIHAQVQNIFYNSRFTQSAYLYSQYSHRSFDKCSINANFCNRSPFLLWCPLLPFLDVCNLFWMEVQVSEL